MPKVNPVLAEGQQAYIDGKGVGECPYRNDPNKADWLRGWKRRQEMYRAARLDGKPVPSVVNQGGRPVGHKPAAVARNCRTCQYWTLMTDNHGVCTGVGPVNAMRKVGEAVDNVDRVLGVAVWPVTTGDDGCRLFKKVVKDA